MSADPQTHPSLAATLVRMSYNEARFVGAAVPGEVQELAQPSNDELVRHVLQNCMPELKQQLAAQGKMITPTEPSEKMIRASMNTVTRSVLNMSKREKHALRLRAALAAQAIKTKQIIP